MPRSPRSPNLLPPGHGGLARGESFRVELAEYDLRGGETNYTAARYIRLGTVAN